MKKEKSNGRGKGRSVRCIGCGNDYYKSVDKCKDGFCLRCILNGIKKIYERKNIKENKTNE